MYTMWAKNKTQRVPRVGVSRKRMSNRLFSDVLLHRGRGGLRARASARSVHGQSQTRTATTALQRRKEIQVTVISNTL